MNHQHWLTPNFYNGLLSNTEIAWSQLVFKNCPRWLVGDILKGAGIDVYMSFKTHDGFHAVSFCL